MKSKSITYGIVGLLLAVAAYWYGSPYIAVNQMMTAAKAGDADSFNEHVDYPRLRESLKGQLSAALTQRMGEQTSSDNGIASAGAAFGAMLGMVMVDKMVDAFVQPEMVMRALQEGRMVPRKSDDGAAGRTGASSVDDKVVWTTERKSLDKVVAYGAKPGDDEAHRIGVVLERSGFANWKLTEIRLPALR